MAIAAKKTSLWVTLMAWFIGLVFLAAAFLKAWDLVRFAEEIGNYQVLPSAMLEPAAFVVIALEALIGVCLITGFQRKIALGAAAGLLIAFLAVTVLRWNVLEGKDCGCFGSFDRGGRGTVLWQDSVLLAIVALTYWFKDRVRGLPWKKMTTVLVTILCLVMATYSAVTAHSKAASLNQSTENQLNIVVYLSSVCPHCIASGEKINHILTTPDLPPYTVYLAAENDGQVLEFLRESHLSVPYHSIPFNVLWLMTRSVPVVELRRGQTIIARWDGENMPPPSEVMASVEAQRKTQ